MFLLTNKFGIKNFCLKFVVENKKKKKKLEKKENFFLLKYNILKKCTFKNINRNTIYFATYVPYGHHISNIKF